MPRSEICSVCLKEVRWGWVPGVTSPAPGGGFWMHQDGNEDHVPVLGHLQDEAERAEIARQYALERTRPDKDGNPVVYTTAQFDHDRMKKSAREEAELYDDIEPPAPAPPPEVWAEPIDDLHDERVPMGVRTITNLLAKNEGWYILQLTYARGPYMGASGKALSISDHLLLKARLDIDGQPSRYLVACWRDGSFDTAYAGELTPGQTPRRVNATEGKAWIKGALQL